MRRRRFTTFAVVIAALAFVVSGAGAQIQRGRELPPKPPRGAALEGRQPPGLPPNLPVSFVSARDLMSRRTAEARVERPGPITLTAECGDGEQLVGGGYAVDRPELGSATPLTVQASYPSAPDTWTVIAYNPDDDPSGPNVGMKVTVEAHCYSPPDRPAAIRIVASAPTVPPLNYPTTGPTTITATCPSGYAALAGGFRIDLAWDELLNLDYAEDAGSTIAAMNSWALGSAPSAVDDAGLAGGWSVTMGPMLEPLPTTTAYALCIAYELPRLALIDCAPPVGPGRTVGRGCGPGPMAHAVSGSINSVSGQGYDFYEGDVACEAGEIGIGGGYRFFASAFIWHQIYRNIGSGSGESWKVGGTTGYQSANYESYDPSGADRSSAVEGWALCARPPDVPLIVRITRPTHRSAVEAVPREDAAGGNLTLSAMAVHGAGAPRSDVSFEWRIDGQPVGSGATLTTSLEVLQCSIRDHRIDVRGTDPAGNTASDDVTVFAGGVC